MNSAVLKRKFTGKPVTMPLVKGIYILPFPLIRLITSEPHD